MKHGFSFVPGSDPDHLKLEYWAEFGHEDGRAIGGHSPEIELDFSSINLARIPIALKSDMGLTYGGEILAIKERVRLPVERGATTKFVLSDHLPFREFHVRQFRQAYVLVRRIAHATEDEMCLKAALAPCYGITQVFDVQVAVPKEILNYESFRRSILIRKT